VLKELQRFLDFKFDPKTGDQKSRNDDVDYARCHVQTNVGEELFVNQVGSWENRPKATCDIPNLFLAGDFCQTVVDVVTVEGAVVSGLNAARPCAAARDRQADRYRPAGHLSGDSSRDARGGHAASGLRREGGFRADSMVRSQFSRMFPNG